MKIPSPPVPSDARGWTQILVRYRKPSLARSIIELIITGGPLVLLWYLMWATLDLGYWLCLLLAVPAAGFLVQHFWRATQSPKILKAAFNLGVAAISTLTAWHVLNYAELSKTRLDFPLIMTTVAGVYFLVNTWPLATITALTEGRSTFHVWRDCYLWTYPYYLLGAWAGAYRGNSKTMGWEVMVLGLVSLYLIYRSYRTYLVRLEDEKQSTKKTP
jgi:hypothetical protein